MSSFNLTRDWLKGVLRPYPSRDRILAEVLDVLQARRTLAVKTDAYTFDSGQTALLLLLHGTLPIAYRGATYQIPVHVWLPHEYPRAPPLAYVVPTRDMGVRKSREVDPGGRVREEVVEAWWRSWQTKDIAALLAQLTELFSVAPPVYAKPPEPASGGPSASPSAQAGPSQPATFSPQHSRPPPPPARPAFAPSNGHAEPLPQYRSAPTPPPAQFSPQSPSRAASGSYAPGAAPQTPPQARSPPVPARPGDAGPPAHPPVPQRPYISRPTIATSPALPPAAALTPPRHDQSPAQHYAPQGPPGPYGLGPPTGPHQPPQHWQHLGPTNGHVQSPTAYDSPTGPPGIPQPAQPPAPVHAPPPAPVPAPRPAVVDLLSSPNQSSSALPGDAALAGPPLPPSKPPPPSLLHLHAILLPHLTASLPPLLQSLHATRAGLVERHEDLRSGEPAIRDEMARLEAVKSVCDAVGRKVGDAVAKGDERVAELEARGEVGVDEIVCGISIVHNQLIDLVAEDNAIEDTIYHMTRALDAERIDLDRFLKSIRVLAREQYMKRALIERILTGMGQTQGW